MCKESVKISASVPISWKLNRRLFNKAMKPYLRPSKWLFHADGRLPYFNWVVNMPIQFCVWGTRYIAARIGVIKGNQGPWGDWENVVNSSEWQYMVKNYAENNQLEKVFVDDQTIEKMLLSDELSIIQRVNLMQVLHWQKVGSL